MFQGQICEQQTLVGENWEIAVELGCGTPESVNAPVHYLGIELSPLQETKLLRMKRITHCPWRATSEGNQSVMTEEDGWQFPISETWDWNPHSYGIFPFRLELCNSRAVSTDGIWVTDLQAIHSSQEVCSQQSGVWRRTLFGPLQTKMHFSELCAQNGGWFIDKAPELYLTLDIAKNTIHAWLMLETLVL